MLEPMFEPMFEPMPTFSYLRFEAYVEAIGNNHEIIIVLIKRYNRHLIVKEC